MYPIMPLVAVPQRRAMCPNTPWERTKSGVSGTSIFETLSFEPYKNGQRNGQTRHCSGTAT